MSQNRREAAEGVVAKLQDVLIYAARLKIGNDILAEAGSKYKDIITTIPRNNFVGCGACDRIITGGASDDVDRPCARSRAGSDLSVAIEILVEAVLEQFQRSAGSRHVADVREIFAVAVGGPDRIADRCP